MKVHCVLNSTLDELEAEDYYYYSTLLPFTSIFSLIHGYVYVFLCVIGVFANASIVVVLLRPAMRKNPFNMFLVAIAVCDATLMATYLLYKHVELCHPWYFSYIWIIYTKYYAIFSVFVHAASLWLTVMMAVLRYLVLYRGQTATTRIPNCNGYGAAMMAIIVAVLIAGIGSLPNMMRYEISGGYSIPIPEVCLKSKFGAFWVEQEELRKYDLPQPDWWSCEWERVNFWTAGLMLKLIPCLLLTLFMTLLVRMLIEARERRSRLCGGVASANSQAERTTAMLTGIVAVFLVTELPQGVLGLAVGFRPRLMFFTNQLGNVFDLLSLINSSVNFVLCALMSHVFRREFLHTFSACCPQSSESHSGGGPPNKHTRMPAGVVYSQQPSVKRNGFIPVPTTSPDEKASTPSTVTPPLQTPPIANPPPQLL